MLNWLKKIRFWFLTKKYIIDIVYKQVILNSSLESQLIDMYHKMSRIKSDTDVLVTAVALQHADSENVLRIESKYIDASIDYQIDMVRDVNRDILIKIIGITEPQDEELQEIEKEENRNE